jgi:hypothetical protein
VIVLPRPGGLRLVSQPDHAGLSARLARAWRRPEGLGAGVWERFLEAVRRHDDGWIEEERRPTLDPRGRPYDFKTLPTPLHTDVWRRSVERAAGGDPYLGLLIAQHGRWLYAEFESRVSTLDREAADRFMEEMDRAIAERRRLLEAGSAEERAAVEEEPLLAARRLLGFFDGLSLRLLGAIRLERAGPLRFGAGEAVVTVRDEGPEILLEPWPFAPEALEVEAEAREVPGERFSAPEELAAALAAAPRARLRWRLAPGGAPP